MESSDSEDEWEYEEDNHFDPADSIFGSEAIESNPLHEVEVIEKTNE